MPRAAKQVDKEDPEYLEKRAKNNEAIKKSREKARAKVTFLKTYCSGIIFLLFQAKETQTKVDHLKKDNKRLEDKITVLGQEMQFLKEVFLAHAGAQNPGAAVAGAAAGVAAGVAAGEQGGDMELLTNLLSEIDQPVPGPSN